LGTTILVITHDRSIADSLPRQVAMLDGRVQSDSATATATATDSGALGATC
jgi:putative ABC transport system ATP-binding protein